jgi:hypothetical protein
MGKVNWTQEQDRLLETLYPSCEAIIIAKQLQKTIHAVRNRAQKLGVRRNHPWTHPEEQELISLVGDYPSGKLIEIYNQWAVKNGFKRRSPSGIFRRLQIFKTSRRLASSSEFMTSEDLVLLFGISDRSAFTWLDRYAAVLKPEPVLKDSHRLCFTRQNLRRFILTYPELIERYRSTVDLIWLVDLVSDRARMHSGLRPLAVPAVSRRETRGTQALTCPPQVKK